MNSNVRFWQGSLITRRYSEQDRSYQWYSKGDIEIAEGDRAVWHRAVQGSFPLYPFIPSCIACVCVTAAMATRSSTDPPAIPATSRYESGGISKPLLSLPYAQHLFSLLVSDDEWSQRKDNNYTIHWWKIIQNYLNVYSLPLKRSISKFWKKSLINFIY